MTPEERAEFIADVAAAIKAVPASLSEDEQRWVRMAIQKEAQSLELRQAIIEKSLTALVLAGLSGLGYLIIDFFKNHGFK
jgi:hypothetical protein